MPLACFISQLNLVITLARWRLFEAVLFCFQIIKHVKVISFCFLKDSAIFFVLKWMDAISPDLWPYPLHLISLLIQ